MKQLCSSIITLFLFTSVFTASAAIGGTTVLGFNASASGNEVAIEWSAMEVNNELFTLQRSADGIEFETISETSGAGTSNTATQYTAIDEQPLEGISYYRLRMEDSNGGFFYSALVSVELTAKAKLHVYPNPAADNEKINISITPEKPGMISVSLYGPSGRRLFFETIERVQGEARTVINTNGLKPGLYTLFISQDGKQIENRRIVIGQMR